MGLFSDTCCTKWHVVKTPEHSEVPRLPLCPLYCSPGGSPVPGLWLMDSQSSPCSMALPEAAGPTQLAPRWLSASSGPSWLAPQPASPQVSLSFSSP